MRSKDKSSFNHFKLSLGITLLEINEMLNSKDEKGFFIKNPHEENLPQDIHSLEKRYKKMLAEFHQREQQKLVKTK